MNFGDQCNLTHFVSAQDGDGDKKPWEKNNTSKFNGGGESPKPSRKRFGSASEEAGTLSVAAGKVNGTAEGSNLDLETLKQEILREMRKEMQKLKSDIVDGEFLNSRVM